VVGIKAGRFLEGAPFGCEFVPLVYFFAPVFRPFWIIKMFATGQDDTGIVKRLR
jgi:hypothetical protein